jgi:hypothetical protein
MKMNKLVAILGVSLIATVATADIMEIDNEKTHNVDCTKDKNVNVSGNENTFNLTGVCTSVNLSGNNNTVTGSVKQVKISGNENKLTLEQVDSILISGDNNSLTYKKTVDAKKKKVGVLNSGEGNKVAKVK